ncbi:hypothetical protein BTO28_04475 [Domibacillus epiphyticus]|uniref:Uncharacterized protein n=1 Tax=Domibacillus epiphyticus TaxID=1714355 RepID=A0A1V2AAE5_9BACI|nr:hypothetical protein BTO28_04475 [Domibacillus epiphyticus]
MGFRIVISLLENSLEYSMFFRAIMEIDKIKGESEHSGRRLCYPHRAGPKKQEARITGFFIWFK